ncbi:DUF6602 domain-containing protein [Candidatus Formimonas warabiya]|uniref:DUF6602 domain-containing protein n=1 Tax=Formimonas warabiya TaxID=1761012 RepID=A0A3G1L095_FORW1|nr:hypothetical protein DCMF_28630 [Candidatus Formimonas warabiya]
MDVIIYLNWGISYARLSRISKIIAREFKAYENRVRNLIDDASWAEEGRFKEIILMNYLRRIVPKNVSVGTGFVRNNDGEITSQVDIIVYDNTYPLLF